MENWQNQDIISNWIWGGIGLTILFVLAIWILVKTYLKKMTEETRQKHDLQLNHQSELLETSVQVQEKERARIAANIHDDLIAQLHRIKLRNKDKEMNSLLNSSIKTARLISHELIPPLLELLQFKELVSDFIAPYAQSHKINLWFNSEDRKNLTTNLKLQLFRITQEVITNIGKHAQAESIHIAYRLSANNIVLRIMDDGIGIKPNAKKGLGMKTIELRSQITKGTYRFKQNKFGGTTFILHIKKT